MINYEAFQTILDEQVEQDIQIVLDYIFENYTYRNEDDLQEILESLDEEEIEFILNEASNFGKADLGGYKPSANQKGASETTTAPRIKVSKPGQAPAKKVKLSSPEPEKKPAEEAPKAEKAAPSKPKPRRGLIRKAADINREKSAAERTQRRKKVFRTSTPKGVIRSKGAKIVDKRDVAVASIGKAVKGMHTAPAGQVQRHSKQDVARSAVQHGKETILKQAKKEIGVMRDRMDGQENKPSTSKKVEAPQRKPFRGKIKTTGVVTGGERDRSPEAKARAKKVKRYLKKGTSARNVQKFVNKERKKWVKTADKKVEAPKQQASKQEAPEKPKTQTAPAPEPKKPRATKKPKIEAQPQAVAAPAAEPKAPKRQRKPKRTASQEQERRSLPARSRQKIGAKEPSFGELETIQKIRSQRRADTPKTERQKRIAELGAKSKKGKAATPPILGKPKVKVVSSSAPSTPKKQEAPKQETPKKTSAAPKQTAKRSSTRRAETRKPKATKSSLPRKGEKRAVSDLSVSRSKLKDLYYKNAPEDRTTSNRERIVRGIKGGIRKYAKKVAGKIKKFFGREDVNLIDATTYLLISEGYDDDTIMTILEWIESEVEADETYVCLEIVETAVDGAMVYNFMVENYEFESENDVYDVMEQLSLEDIEYIVESAY